MSRIDDLKSLLERLKGEVSASPGPDLPSERGAGAPGTVPILPLATLAGLPAGRQVNRDSPQPRPGQPPRPEFIRPDKSGHCSQIWANKETMLFGMLASVIVLLGGLAASLVWLTAIGAAFFVLFAAVMAAVFRLRPEFPPCGRRQRQFLLSAKLEQLARRWKVGLRGRPARESSSAFRGGDRDLERKVEELRMLVSLWPRLGKIMSCDSDIVPNPPLSPFKKGDEGDFKQILHCLNRDIRA